MVKQWILKRLATEVYLLKVHYVGHNSFCEARSVSEGGSFAVVGYRRIPFDALNTEQRLAPPADAIRRKYLLWTHVNLLTKEI
jgi:hypothetical protein